MHELSRKQHESGCGEKARGERVRRNGLAAGEMGTKFSGAYNGIHGFDALAEVFQRRFASLRTQRGLRNEAKLRRPLP